MQHINNIDTGSNLRLIRNDLLFSVYYKFRNSITCIRLLDDRHTINFNSQQINILNSLTQFKKLTKLELHNKNDINLTPFYILENCPNLEHLVFFSYHDSICESAMQHILDNDRRINLSFISSLAHLDLYLPYLSATYTRCLIDYFPNQLTNLNITISIQNIFGWIDIVGMELALRLMEKVGSIDKTYIGFVRRDENFIQVHNGNNMTKYFKLLNSFRGARQTHCTAHFKDTGGKMRYLGNSFRYNSLGGLFVTYALYRSDFHGSIIADISVPDKAISIIGLEIFDVLEFNLSSLYDDDVYRVLNYSLSNCPRLLSLNVMWDLLGGLHSSLSFGHKDGQIYFDQANHDINFLQMDHIRPTKNIFDFVTTHLRNIEIVSLKAKDWSWVYNKHVIDLTGFKKLKSFIYISTHIRFTKEDKFVLIKYTNGTEERRILEYGKTRGMGGLSFTVLCDTSVSLDIREEEIEN
ncbi:hypothetical protein HPULCUR_011894 [Helicostylum pulchrum]|uniref:Uncharacterized protein n=2 Tax=Helicostylum pulchrum TaxID=562976 RepID=A0ABP9YHF5_9FUNG